jgi:hypothetical protein
VALKYKGVQKCTMNITPIIVDDSLIPLKADLHNATSLQRVLDTYWANSRQLVSVSKSSVFFSPNTHVDTRVEICNTLNINIEALSDKYLGLPALVGADRSDCFLHFDERIIHMLKGWKEKLLSIGVRKFIEDGGSINSCICYVTLQTAKEYL